MSEQPAPARPASPSAPSYSLAVGYIRPAIILVVLIFHSVIAYYAGPPPYTEHVLRMSFPVRDPKHFAAVRIFAVFADNYAMSLMFFISGLFVWASLRRHGVARFVRERALRLGLPFLICAGPVCALAYYAAYMEFYPVGDVANYFATWETPLQWLSGPAWFLSFLLGLDLLTALAFMAAPGLGERLARLAAGAKDHPLRFFAIVVAISALAYVPLALAFGPYDWWSFGPLWVQKCRPLQYVAYFALGIAVGVYGIERGLLAVGGRLARRWWAWTAASIATFLIVGNLLRYALNAHAERSLGLGGAADVGWVVGCAVSSFATLALFVRFAKPNRIMDSLAANCFGMYLFHYPLVTWTQYALLHAPMSAAARALIVVTVVISGSWALTAALRRIPGVARII